MTSPLPDLIMDRVTNGLFYDVVDGGGSVHNEVGRRFEEYSLALLSGMLQDVRFVPETRYRTPLGRIDTPDILMRGYNGAVQIAIECKASRMSVSARFSHAPEGDRGYEEIAKGVMQLWRFFAHCSQQVATDRLDENAQGLILTLDEWFAGRSTIIPHIIARAHELADVSAHDIPADARRPVAFCTISELETVLVTATPGSLAEAVQIGSGDRAGWLFSELHRETTAEKTAPKRYPFERALDDLLPWHARLTELAESDLPNDA